MSRQPNQSTHRAVIVERRAPRFLRYADAARDLGASPAHVRNLVKRGVVRAVELDGLKLIPSDAWDEYLATAKPLEVSS